METDSDKSLAADASKEAPRPILDLAFALTADRRSAFFDKASKSGAITPEEMETTFGLIEGLPTPRPSLDIDDIQCGSIIGRYRILEKIGEGASANVYMVDQIEPVRRRVALKVIKLGMDTREVMARFDAEKQALAMMDHPNIARVLDAGATPSGRPYFVMELVKGVPITHYCDKNHLTPEERLELLLPVCLGVQHAHMKGIIHRDLKPNNILVTLHDGVPVPKVIDFGIAKATDSRLTDHTLFTKFHQFVGTPAYMSPEQAEMSGLDVDTRSDVYSLGVLMYELITGSTPFESQKLLDAGYDRLRKAITEEEPPIPSTRLSSLEKDGLTVIAKYRRLEPGSLSDHVKGELDWIVMKALDKDRTRRYQSAAALGQEIQRYLNDEPVEACPPNKVYRLCKTIRRHRGAALAAALICLSLVAGTLLAMNGWRRATREASDALRQAKRADTVSHLLFEMFESATPGSNQGRQYTVMQLLDDFGRDLQGHLSQEPEVEYSLRQVLARAYEGLGEYLESEKHWRRSKELARTIYGSDSAQELAADVRLGWVFHQMGHLEEARALIESSLGRQRELLGENHADCLESAIYLVEIWHGEGDLHKAEQLARSVLARYETMEDRPQRQWIWLQQILAGICRDQGRLDEAETISHRVLAVASQRHGEDNPHTFKAIHTLAQSFFDRGRFADGEALLEGGLERARRSLGENHPMTLTLWSDISALRQTQGRREEAVSILENVLKIQKERLGADHTDTLRTMLKLAEFYRADNRTEDAETLTRGAAAISRDQLGDRHLLTFDSVAAHLQLLLDEKRFSEAEPLARASYETAAESLGPDHPSSVRIQLLLADLHMGLERPRESEAIYREVLNRQQRREGTAETAILETKAKLAVSLEKLRRFREASSTIEPVFDRRAQLLGEAHPETLEALLFLGRMQLHLWHSFDAESLLKKAWLGLEKADGMKEQWCLAGKLFAESFYQRRRQTEAIEYGEKVYQDALHALGENHAITQECIDMLSVMRSARERAEENVAGRSEAYLALEPSVSWDRRLTLLAELTLAHASAEQHEATERSLAELETLIAEHFPGVAHWQIVLLYVKAQVHQRRGERDLARSQFLEAMERCRQHPEPGERDLDRDGSLIRSVEYEYFAFASFDASIATYEALADDMLDAQSNVSWPAGHTRILVPRSSSWRYLADRIEDPDKWERPDFLDGSWREGRAPFGHDIRNIATFTNAVVPGRFRPITTYFRTTFVASGKSNLKSLKIRLRCNDGAIVYINGREAVRRNLPDEVMPGTRALAMTDPLDNYRSRIHLVDPGLLREGVNIIAVELHQFEQPVATAVFDLQLEALLN